MPDKGPQKVNGDKIIQFEALKDAGIHNLDSFLDYCALIYLNMGGNDYFDEGVFSEEINDWYQAFSSDEWFEDRVISYVEVLSRAVTLKARFGEES